MFFRTFSLRCRATAKIRYTFWAKTRYIPKSSNKPTHFCSCAVAECYACSSARRLLVACAFGCSARIYISHHVYIYIFFFFFTYNIFVMFFTRFLRWRASLNKKCWWVVLVMVGQPAPGGSTDLPRSYSLTHNIFVMFFTRFLRWRASLNKKCWWVVLVMVGQPAPGGSTDPRSYSLTHNPQRTPTNLYLPMNQKRFLCWHKSLKIQKDPINDNCRNTAKREKPPTQ